MADVDFMPAFSTPSEPAAPPIPEVKASDPIEVRIVALAVVVPATAAALKVTRDNLVAAYAYAKVIRGYRDEWAAHMNPHIVGAQEAKRVAEANRKRLVTDFESRDAPLAASEALVMKGIAEVEDAAEQERQIEQRRLQAIEDERAKQEKAKQEEALRVEAAAAAEAMPEVAQALTEAADEIAAAPPAVVTVELPPVRPSGTGVSRPVTWEAKIDDLSLLLAAVVESLKMKKLKKMSHRKAPPLDDALLVDITDRIKEAIMPALNPRATRLKAALNIPGVSAAKKTGYRM